MMIMIRAKMFGLVILAALGLGSCSAPGQGDEDSETSAQITVERSTVGRNASFTMNGALVTLVDGVSSPPMQDSPARTTTRYLGGEAAGDLNGDGLEDFSFWVTQDTGGSGAFYYVVVALQTPSGYTTTNAFLVGDRIVPESMQIRADAGELHVNFVGRTRDEPMTTPPSEPKVLLLKVTRNGILEGLMS